MSRLAFYICLYNSHIASNHGVPISQRTWLYQALLEVLMYKNSIVNKYLSRWSDSQKGDYC